MNKDKVFMIGICLIILLYVLTMINYAFSSKFTSELMDDGDSKNYLILKHFIIDYAVTGN